MLFWLITMVKLRGDCWCYTVVDCSQARKAERRLSRIADSASDLVLFDWDMVSNVLWVNAAFSKMFH